MGERRLRLTRISLELLASVLRGEGPGGPVETDAPSDLRVVGIEQPFSGLGSWAYLLVESASFDPVPEGASIPEIGPFVFHRKE